MPVNYQDEIDAVALYNVIPTLSVYDYRGLNYEDLYNQFYKFCRESLDFHSVNIDITPNIFVFYNNLNINAKAGYNGNVFVILFYNGLFRWAIENLLNNENIDNYLEKNYKKIIEKFDNDLNVLNFQVSTNFTYYHEVAHLIQKSKKKLLFDLQERPNTESEYSYQSHLLELNADAYASIAIATHITQYLEKTFADTVSYEDFHFTVKFLGSCLFYYIMSFSDSLEPIYYYEKSHPHPIVRLFNILINVSHHLTNSDYLEENKITFNQFQLLQDVFTFYNELESEKVFNSDVGSIIETTLNDRKNIIDYLTSFLEFNDDEHFDALEKWNLHINEE